MLTTLLVAALSLTLAFGAVIAPHHSGRGGTTVSTFDGTGSGGGTGGGGSITGGGPPGHP